MGGNYKVIFRQFGKQVPSIPSNPDPNIWQHIYFLLEEPSFPIGKSNSEIDSFSISLFFHWYIVNSLSWSCDNKTLWITMADWPTTALVTRKTWWNGQLCSMNPSYPFSDQLFKRFTTISFLWIQSCLLERVNLKFNSQEVNFLTTLILFLWIQPLAGFIKGKWWTLWLTFCMKG